MPIPGDSSGYTWPPTLTEAKAQVNATRDTNDDELQTVLDAAVAILENHPDYRVKDAVTATSYAEWHDGGSQEIILAHYPIIAVTSIAEYTPTAQALAAEPLDTTTTFTGYGYTVNALAGILGRTSGGISYPFSGRIKIVYTAGAAVVPADIRTAALKLTQHLWGDQRGTGAGRAVPRFQGAGASSDEFQPPVTAHLLPWEVEELLAPYRRIPAVA